MRMLDYALKYAELNWSIIPVIPHNKDKKPYVPWKKFQSERPSGDQIKKWWTKCPTANIGLITGEISGVIAIDIDSALGQQVYTALFEEIHGTISQTTGKPGGMHLLFKHPMDGILYKNMTRVIDDIDIRGDGGFIVIAPSIHNNGVQYKWEIDPLDDIDAMMDLPPKVKEMCIPKSNGTVVSKKREKDPQWVQVLLCGVEKGKRNDACAKLAGHYLRVFDGNIEKTLGILEMWNPRNLPPLDQKEVEKTVLSISERHGRTMLSEALGNSVIKKIVINVDIDNSKTYELFLEGCKGCISLKANELDTFHLFRHKFLELANYCPRPMKQAKWEVLLNSALLEAEIVNIAPKESRGGPVLRVIDDHLAPEPVQHVDDLDPKPRGFFQYLNDTIYVSFPHLQDTIAQEKYKFSNQEISKILVCFGFIKKTERIMGTQIRFWVINKTEFQEKLNRDSIKRMV